MIGRGRHGAPRAWGVLSAQGDELLSHLLTVTVTGGLGLLVLISNPRRFGSPSYVALQQSFGGVTLWGVILLASGVWLALAAAGSMRALVFALLGTAVVHTFITYSFIVAAASDAQASPWGYWLFGALAARHIMLALHLRPDLR